MIIAPSLQFLGAPIAVPRPSSRPLPSRSASMPATRFSAAYTHAPPPAGAAAVGSSSSSLYDVLGIPAGATGQEIKAAYRRLSRTCHPDVAASERKGASADEFMRIHAAYSTLSDPDKRADYDLKLLMIGRQRRPVRSPPSSFGPTASPFSSGFSRRTWETDQCW